MKTENGYGFNVSITADGEHLTLVAFKDDHEGRRNHVFNLTPESAKWLVQLIEANCRNARDRRKAMRRAEREAKQ